MRVQPVVWLTLLSLLAAPGMAHASFLDILWKMSGPRMVGTGVRVDVPLTRREDPDVSIAAIQLVRPKSARNRGETHEDRLWLNFEARAYFSTDTRVADNGATIRWGAARMLGFDPMLAWRYGSGDTRWHSGVGLSFNRFFGREFETFGNYAVKVRVLGVDRRAGSLRIGGSYVVRWYPDGFGLSGATGEFSRIKAPELVQGPQIDLTF